MEDLSNVADTIREASALISGSSPDDGGPSSFLQAVVLGSAGSGKSAVLNTLIGHPVLPTAEGGATRYPLVVDLKKDETVSEGYVRGSMGTTTDLKSSAEIRKAIVAEMKRWLPNSSRVHEQAHLIVSTKTAPALRLVDLPGLESRASEQDNLVRDNANSNDAILLVIIPATDVKDVLTTRAFKLAQDLDREGSRSIGIITKLDLVKTDKETVKHVIDLISAQGPIMTQDFPWVTVLGQPLGEDYKIESLESAWKTESDMLYSIIKSAGGKQLDDRLGRSGLVRVLARQVRKRMKDRIPKLLSSLEDRSQEVEDELFRLGKSINTTVDGSRAVALELCRGFEIKFIDHIHGAESGGSKMVEKFVGSLPNRFRALPLDELFSLESVKKVALEADGYLPYLISPEKGLRLLVKRTLELAKQPGLTCVDEVHKILLDILAAAGNSAPSLMRFPPLKRELVAIASSILDDYRIEARNMVNSLVDMERVFIPPGFFMEATAKRQEKTWRDEELLRRREQAISQRRVNEQPEPGRMTAAMNMLRSKKEPPPPPPISGPLPELSGYLWKVSSKNGWSKRWFALSDKTARLYYVKKPDEKTPRGVIPLEDCIVEDTIPAEEYPSVPSSDSKDLVFRISNNVPYKTVVKVHHSLILRAENVADKIQWVTRVRLLTKNGKKENEQSASKEQAQASEPETETNDEPNLPPSASVSSTKSSSSASRDKGGEKDIMKRQPKDPDEDLKAIAQDVRQYVDMVLGHLAENIPKAIILIQVERVKDLLLTKLYTSISVLSDERISTLLEEDPESKAKRENFQKQHVTLDKLRRALSFQEAQTSAEESNSTLLTEKEKPVQEDWRNAFRQAGSSNGPVDEEEEHGESLFVPFSPSSSFRKPANGRFAPSEIPRDRSTSSQSDNPLSVPRSQPPPSGQRSPLRQSSPSRPVNGPPDSSTQSMGAPMRRAPGRQAPIPPSVPR